MRETRVQRLEKFPLNKYRRVDPNDEGTRGEGSFRGRARKGRESLILGGGNHLVRVSKSRR